MASLLPTRLDSLGLALSAGPLVGLVGLILAAPEAAATTIDTLFAGATTAFGLGWQILVLATFVGAVGLALSPWGAARLGGVDAPERGFLPWLAILLCTLLAGGGVFWSAAEPMFHFLTPPPTAEGVEGGTVAAVDPALAQSHLHWGFLAWSVVGTLAAVALSASRVRHGVPLRPRALLHPLLGDAAEGPLGSVVDAVSVVAVVAGTVGPIGFLAVQLGYAVQVLTGLPDGLPVRLALLGALVVLYTVSAVSGIERGIAWLSRLNVGLALLLGVVLVVLGSGGFVLSHFATSMGTYLLHLPEMALDRSDPGWLDDWTLFYWGWFLGYGPMMALFTARVSRGRTVRELVLAVAIAAPLVTNLWFSLLGGTAIAVELDAPGTVSGPLGDHGLGAALLATLQALPGAWVLIPAFIVLIFTFLATTGDSMAFAIAVVQSRNDEPPTGLRILWAVLMGGLAAGLLALGDGGIDTLQRFIVVTAVPVSLLLAVTLVTGPLGARDLLRAQERRE